MSLNSIVFGIDAIDNATPVFKKVGQGLGVLAGAAGSLGGALAIANIAGNFEAAVAKAGAVAQASAEDLRLMHDAALKAGRDTQFAPIEAANALQDLASRGYDAKDAIELLNPVLLLAGGSLGELTPSGAAGLASQALQAFGIEVKKVDSVVDQLMQSVNLFSITASDLPLALGAATRGARTMKQNLDETLISFGLVKDIIHQTERSATAVSVAMERMVDPRVQMRLKNLGDGVKVTFADGKFRPFLDVVKDMIPQLKKLSDAQQGAFLLKTFGQEGLSGISSIMARLESGVKNAKGELVKGGEAIDELRRQLMKRGVAAEFNQRLLETFEGQKKLLKGSMETLAIVIGEPLAHAFKPLVTFILQGVNMVVNAIQSIPEPVKDVLAKIFVGIAVFGTLIGALLTAKVAISVLISAMGAFGISIGGIIASLAPLLGIFSLLSLVVAAFVVSFRHNVGGVADFCERTIGRISLFFEGLGQLMKSGEFSGDVLKKLNTPDTTGLRKFAEHVFMILHRIKAFFGGIADGFSSAIEKMKPVFDAFYAALRKLGEALGFFGNKVDTIAGIATSKFRSAGQPIGEVLAKIAGVVINVFTAALHIFIGFVNGVRDGFARARPIFVGFVNAVGDLYDTFKRIGKAGGEALGSLSFEKFESVGEFIGRLFTKVASLVVKLLTIAVRVYDGYVQGLSAALSRGRPIFQAFVDAIVKLGEALGLVDKAGEAASDALPGDKFISAGKIIGDLVGSVITEVVKGITHVVRFVTGIVDGFKEVVEFLSPVFGFMAKAIGYLIEAIAGTTSTTDAGGSAWTQFGRVLGWIAGLIVSVVAGAVGILAGALGVIINIVKGVASAIGAVIGFFFVTIPNAFRAAAKAVMEFFQPAIDLAMEILQPFIDVISFAAGVVKTIFAVAFDILEAAMEPVLAILELVGKVIAWAAGIVKDIFAVAFDVLMFAMRPFIEIGRAIGEILMWLGGLIVDGIVYHFHLFKEAVHAVFEKLSKYFAPAVEKGASAMNRIKEIVQAVKDRFHRLADFIRNDIPDAFKAVWDGVKQFLQPVVDVFHRVVEAIRDTIDRMIAFIGRMVDKLPSKLRPAFLDRVVDAGKEAQARVDAREAASTAIDQTVVGTAMPAVAQARSNAEIRQQEMADFMGVMNPAKNSTAPTIVNAHFHVGGEHLATAVGKVERDQAYRGGLPVPSEAL